MQRFAFLPTTRMAGFLPVVAKRWFSDGQSAHDVESLYYVYKSGGQGAEPQRLSEVFLCESDAEQFCNEKESHDLGLMGQTTANKIHYYTEEVEVERQVVKAGGAKWGGEHLGPAHTRNWQINTGLRAVSGNDAGAFTHISLQNLGAPEKDRTHPEWTKEVNEFDASASAADCKAAEQYERILYEVWHQDALGNCVRCEPAYDNQEKAKSVAAELTELGQNQHYFVETVAVRDVNATQ